jgi:hypothetical protein
MSHTKNCLLLLFALVVCNSEAIAFSSNHGRTLKTFSTLAIEIDTTIAPPPPLIGEEPTQADAIPPEPTADIKAECPPDGNGADGCPVAEETLSGDMIPEEPFPDEPADDDAPTEDDVPPDEP